MDYSRVLVTALTAESDPRWAVVLIAHLVMVYEQGFGPADVVEQNPAIIDGSLYMPIIPAGLLSRMRKPYSPETDGPSLALIHYTNPDSKASITLSWTAFEKESILCQAVENQTLKNLSSWSQRITDWAGSSETSQLVNAKGLSAIRELCKSISKPAPRIQGIFQPQEIPTPRETVPPNHRRPVLVPGDPGFSNPSLPSPYPFFGQTPDHSELVGPDHPLFSLRRPYFYPEGP